MIGARDVIDTDDGRMRVPGKTITDKHDCGPLDPAGVLRVSSNIGAVKIGYALGPRAHFEMLRASASASSTAQPVPRRIVGRVAPLEASGGRSTTRRSRSGRGSA